MDRRMAAPPTVDRHPAALRPAGPGIRVSTTLAAHRLGGRPRPFRPSSASFSGFRADRDCHSLPAGDGPAGPWQSADVHFAAKGRSSSLATCSVRTRLIGGKSTRVVALSVGEACFRLVSEGFVQVYPDAVGVAGLKARLLPRGRVTGS